MKKPILPPTYFVVLLVLSAASHIFLPAPQIVDYPYILLGFPLIVFGIWLNLAADSLFEKRKTTVKPHEKPSALVTDGPFRISRHPMYLGMASFLLGEAVLLGSLVTFAYPLIFVLIMEAKFIPLEEKSMQDSFKEQYAGYKKKVRRWV